MLTGSLIRESAPLTCARTLGSSYTRINQSSRTVYVRTHVPTFGSKQVPQPGGHDGGRLVSFAQRARRYAGSRPRTIPRWTRDLAAGMGSGSSGGSSNGSGGGRSPAVRATQRAPAVQWAEPAVRGMPAPAPAGYFGAAPELQAPARPIICGGPGAIVAATAVAAAASVPPPRATPAPPEELEDGELPE